MPRIENPRDAARTEIRVFRVHGLDGRTHGGDLRGAAFAIRDREHARAARGLARELGGGPPFADPIAGEPAGGDRRDDQIDADGRSGVVCVSERLSDRRDMRQEPRRGAPTGAVEM
jgi:hypothetical protein